jgi:prepilin-type N-terminal cleavage/methylation domain-containing protein
VPFGTIATLKLDVCQDLDNLQNELWCILRSPEEEAGAVVHECRDDGFTLIEVLIVVVILAILAAVVVTSVRGSTPEAQQQACRSVARTYQTAIEAWYGSPAISGDADGHPSGPEIESADLVRLYNDAMVRVLVPTDVDYAGNGRSTVAAAPGGICDGLIAQG